MASAVSRSAGRPNKRPAQSGWTESVAKRRKTVRSFNSKHCTGFCLHNSVKVPRTSHASQNTEQQLLQHAKARANLKYYAKLINECAKRKNINLAFQLYSQLKSQNITPNIFLYSGLINACVRASDMQKAEEIIVEMKNAGINPNVVTYTVLVKGYANMRNLERAVAIVNEDMKREGVAANIVTYKTILRECYREGATNLAAEIIKQMKSNLISPDRSCLEILVKCFTQAGQLDEAHSTLTQLEKAHGNEVDPNVYLLLASMNAILGKKLSTVDGLLQKFDKALERTKASPANEEADQDDATESKRNNRLKPLELLVERDIIQKFVESKRSGTIAQTFAVKDLIRGPRASPFVYFDGAQPPLVDKTGIKDIEAMIENLSAGKVKAPPMRLEICAGAGDWLLQMAQNTMNKDEVWIALERRYDRIHEIWRKVIMKGLKNVVLLAGDARSILRRLPEDSMDEVFVHFPEPPRSEENMDRLIDCEFLQMVHRVLKPSARLSILTDDDHYCTLIVDDLRNMSNFKAPSECGDLGYVTELPEGYGTSFFDQLWSQRGRKSRFLIQRTKVAPVTDTTPQSNVTKKRKSKSQQSK